MFILTNIPVVMDTASFDDTFTLVPYVGAFLALLCGIVLGWIFARNSARGRAEKIAFYRDVQAWAAEERKHVAEKADVAKATALLNEILHDVAAADARRGVKK